MTWKFDKTVADVFESHARKHIPHYDSVIDLSVSLCQQHARSKDHIVDFGCATGLTLKRLHQSGFSNLTGIDNSADMLDRCDPTMAKLVLSDGGWPLDTNPSCRVIMANWTMHFCPQKETILAGMYQSLEPGGIMIITDKTSQTNMALTQYHRWKHQQGVSHSEIQQKADSLKGVMHVQQVKWWLATLDQMGFCDVEIADAAWCFTTFVAVKPK